MFFICVFIPFPNAFKFVNRMQTEQRERLTDLDLKFYRTATQYHALVCVDGINPITLG